MLYSNLVAGQPLLLEWAVYSPSIGGDAYVTESANLTYLLLGTSQTYRNPLLTTRLKQRRPATPNHLISPSVVCGLPVRLFRFWLRATRFIFRAVLNSLYSPTGT